MAWKSSAVAAHSEPPSIFFYRCWSGVCGKGYEDVVLECLRASGASHPQIWRRICRDLETYTVGTH